MINANEIKQWIEQGLPSSQAWVEGDGRHFEATVICADFANKSRIQRHRLVYEASGERMHNQIHALSLKTYTPEERGKYEHK